MAKTHVIELNDSQYKEYLDYIAREKSMEIAEKEAREQDKENDRIIKKYKPVYKTIATAMDILEEIGNRYYDVESSIDYSERLHDLRHLRKDYERVERATLLMDGAIDALEAMLQEESDERNTKKPKRSK